LKKGAPTLYGNNSGLPMMPSPKAIATTARPVTISAPARWIRLPLRSRNHSSPTAMASQTFTCSAISASADETP
jgi:hypothetical protein